MFKIVETFAGDALLVSALLKTKNREEHDRLNMVNPVSEETVQNCNLYNEEPEMYVHDDCFILISDIVGGAAFSPGYVRIQRKYEDPVVVQGDLSELLELKGLL